MEQLKDYFIEKIEEIKINADLRHKLVTDAFAKHSFYVYLPFDILEQYHSLTNTYKMEFTYKLSVFSYLYFSSLLCFDKYYDNQLKGDSVKDILKVMLLTVNEYALRGLYSILSNYDNFWTNFESIRSVFLCSNYDYTHNDDHLYFEYCRGKSILTHAYTNAFYYKYGDLPHREEIEAGIDNFHIGVQIFDDYKDISEDIRNGQPNYFVYLLKGKKKIVITNNIQRNIKLMYVSGCMEKGLKESLEYVTKALNTFKSLNMKKSLEQCEVIENLIRAELHYIMVSMVKAKEKAQKSDVIIRKNNVKISQEKGLIFLQKNVSEDGSWKDFITNAGYGINWITAYVLCMIDDFEIVNDKFYKSISFIHNSRNSYNSFIVSDCDSLNFKIKANLLLKSRNEDSIINDWLQFQNQDGGWATYNNDDIKKAMKMPPLSDFSGWQSSQVCVSSVAAWVLSKMSKSSILRQAYTNTIGFLIKKQNNDGSWDSYWWTEKIYSTSFCVMALISESKYYANLNRACNYLLSTQGKDGSWNSKGVKSCFYTSLALKALMIAQLYRKDTDFHKNIREGIYWLLSNQYEDGSWPACRILQLPMPNVHNINEIKKWANSSFGLNCIVDDHNRIFTTATVYNCISYYENRYKKNCLHTIQ